MANAIGYNGGKIVKIKSGVNLDVGAGDLLVDTIVESSTGSGVEIEGVMLKENDIILPNGSTIGSAGAPGAITIADSGLVTIANDFQVNGTTTTVNQTNLDVSDNIIGLNRGASSNANDSGLIIERGSTGDNAAIIWDESADKFVVGTTQSDASSTGNLTITSGTLVAATFEGALTGNVTGTVSDISNHDTDDLSEGSTNLYFTDARAQAAISVTDSSEIDFSFSSGAISGSLKDGSISNGRLANSAITLSDGSNTTAIDLGGTMQFAAGEGLDVVESSGTVTFSAEDASDSNKGVASFDSAHFTVTSGAVTLAADSVAFADLVQNDITKSSDDFGSDATNDDHVPTTKAVKAFVDSATASELELNVNAASNLSQGEFVGFFAPSGGSFGLHALESGFTAEVVGVVANTTVNSGSPVSVFKEGIVTQIDNVTGVSSINHRGSRVYLAGDAGSGQSLTLTPPTSGAVVQVGILLEHTSDQMKMLLKIQHIMDN